MTLPPTATGWYQQLEHARGPRRCALGRPQGLGLRLSLWPRRLAAVFGPEDGDLQLGRGPEGGDQRRDGGGHCALVAAVVMQGDHTYILVYGSMTRQPSENVASNILDPRVSNKQK